MSLWPWSATVIAESVLSSHPIEMTHEADKTYFARHEIRIASFNGSGSSSPNILDDSCGNRADVSHLATYNSDVHSPGKDRSLYRSPTPLGMTADTPVFHQSIVPPPSAITRAWFLLYTFLLHAKLLQAGLSNAALKSFSVLSRVRLAFDTSPRAIKSGNLTGSGEEDMHSSLTHEKPPKRRHLLTVALSGRTSSRVLVSQLALHRIAVPQLIRPCPIRFDGRKDHTVTVRGFKIAIREKTFRSLLQSGRGKGLLSIVTPSLHYGPPISKGRFHKLYHPLDGLTYMFPSVEVAVNISKHQYEW
ncbi:hypothetical protein EV401DRAFT_2200747 [Pisolithus croceorrhizus]|nr:hypothetical protein EV401DRAFT_2200747 [Pisolithus croceorrhizus]